MSLSEQQRLPENESHRVRNGEDEQTSSNESDDQPETSSAAVLQTENPAGQESLEPTTAAENQSTQTMEIAETSRSGVNTVDPSNLIKLTDTLTKRVGAVLVNYAPRYYHHDSRQYQDKREYFQMDVRDSVNVTPTRVKSMQVNSQGHLVESRHRLSTPELSTGTSQSVSSADPSDFTRPKQLIGSTLHAEPPATGLAFNNQKIAKTSVTSPEGHLIEKRHRLSTPELPQRTSQTVSSTDPSDFTRPNQLIGSTPHAEPPATGSALNNQTIAKTTVTSPEEKHIDGNSGKSSKKSKSKKTSSFLQKIKRRLPKHKGKTAVESIMHEQNKYGEDDICLQSDIKISKDIPKVHPSYTRVSFFQAGALPKEEVYKPLSEKLEEVRSEGRLQFKDVVRHGKHFIALIGYPGSGKTTFSKRLAKLTDYKCFHYSFMDMNYKQNLTLQQLLLEKRFPNINLNTHKQAFEWIKENQKKCLFIFDGLDQFEWNLGRHPAKEDYGSPQPIQDLVANLCTGHFLPDSLIVFTSRPHSIVTLPKSLRPDTTILIGDLPLDGMKKLFYFFAGPESKKLWNRLSKNNLTFPVFRLCFNPLLLQLVIVASLNPAETVGDITSTTRVFATVFMYLQHSENARYENISRLTEQLSTLAYNATVKATVVITPDEMREQGLEPNEAQDVIIQLHSYFGVTSKVFEHDTKFFYAHQSYQEYFTALWIVNQMPLDYFQLFIKEQLFSDQKWSVVRAFLSGLLMDVMRDQNLSAYLQAGFDRHNPSTSGEQSTTINQHASDIAEKRSIFAKALEMELGSFSSLTFDDWDEEDQLKRRYISLLVEISECADHHLAQKAVDLFPQNLYLSNTKLNSSETAILCEILRKQKNNIKRLYLYNCFSNPDDVKMLISAIIEMPGKIEKLSIGFNVISEIPPLSFFEKVNERLVMLYCFPDENRNGRLPNQSEVNQIQATLNQLDRSNLEVPLGDVTLRPQTK
ncbi:unnamed protein product [Clavelina lepadiformis]|uniref:NACHT domain-containing protein n=1 Tax=Clavelina lepadiformis TaxID=159417 RepID=A0ABP0FJN7_CLALP